jgi:hypothetical protein
MVTFLDHLKSGIWYVLNVQQHLLILFLVLVTIPYVFKEWKKISIILGLLIISQLLAVILGYYKIITINFAQIQIFLQIALVVLGLYNLNVHTVKSVKNEKLGVLYTLIVLFGLVFGLVVIPASFYLNQPANFSLFSLLQYTSGIWVAEIGILFLTLITSALVQHFFKITKRDWVLASAFLIIGMVLPLLIKKMI